MVVKEMHLHPNYNLTGNKVSFGEVKLYERLTAIIHREEMMNFKRDRLGKWNTTDVTITL